MIALYLSLAAFVSIYGLSRLPAKMNALDDIGGSVVAGVALGWLAWPFILWAVWKQRGGVKL